MDKRTEDEHKMDSLKKRRGRPPKQKPATPLPEQGAPSEVIHPEPLPVVAEALPEAIAIASPIEMPDNRAQALACRIWDGQSPDLPLAERKARIAAGLARQGLNIDAVRWSDAGYGPCSDHQIASPG